MGAIGIDQGMRYKRSVPRIRSHRVIKPSENINANDNDGTGWYASVEDYDASQPLAA